MQLSCVCRMRYLAKSFVFVTALGLVSCSGGAAALNPVRGTVLYKDAPAGGVLVTLHLVGANEATSQPSTGYTNEDGTFDIVTGQDEGAPAGEYVVTMIWMQEVAGAKKKGPVISMREEIPRADKLKGKYSDQKKPVFSSVTVKKGVNELEPFRLQ